jgi:hypothetical protein
MMPQTARTDKTGTGGRSEFKCHRRVTRSGIPGAAGEYRRPGEPRNLPELRSHRCIVGSVKRPPLAWSVREGDVEKRFAPPATHMSNGEAMAQRGSSAISGDMLPVIFRASRSCRFTSSWPLWGDHAAHGAGHSPFFAFKIQSGHLRMAMT